jgi:hypothetical protein
MAGSRLTLSRSLKIYSLRRSKRLVVLIVVFLVLLFFSFLPAKRVAKHRYRSKIAKVSVAFNELDSSTIQRAFETHFKHNAMHGYRHLIARQRLVDEIFTPEPPWGSWSKPAYLLSILAKELSKPPEKRLEWLL